MSSSPTLVWFRSDLRLQDNPALLHASQRGGAVIPVYIAEDDAADDWREGAASRWWRHHALLSLDRSLRERGSQLVIARGDPREVLAELRRETEAGAVYWNRRYEPSALARDADVKNSLTADGAEGVSFNAALLHEPHEISNKQGGPFQVFTPFWRHCLARPVAPPLKLPDGALPAPASWPRTLTIEELGLRPSIGWDAGIQAAWTPGEEAGARRLREFVKRSMHVYDKQRDLPAVEGTSRLSPWLHHGELSPRQIWAAVKRVANNSGVFPPSKGASVFLTEIGWREFSYHLLYHFPTTTTQPLRREFSRFPWREDPGARLLQAWRKGQTGYPIVDAGMRQLWSTGWMHNRVRMIAASFLVKHLRLPWQEGARWFWDTLVDADLASNTLGWQWTAGCGADAAPYFRVFAPVLQGRKFDPDGSYVRHWVPELARLPVPLIHAPWEASADELARAGVTLGGNYPAPIVDHAEAREEALAAYRSLKGA